MKAQAIFEVSLILALLVGAFIAGAIVALIQDRKRLRRMHQQARAQASEDPGFQQIEGGGGRHAQ
jgi:uncharacterized integral membrane protein